VVRVGRGVIGGAPVQGVPLVAPVGATLLLMRRRGRSRRRRLLCLRLFLLLVQLLDRLYFLLQLHPPVLEPDLNLALGQAERVRHLYSPPPGEVVIRVEFLLELEGLVARVGLAAASA
jgi:hypothetical protein